MKFLASLSFSFIFIFAAQKAGAQCQIMDSSRKPAPQQMDPLYLLLKTPAECPQNVIELKNELLSLGLQVQPSMVANRGRNNPAHGSFSFFEVVTGLAKFSAQHALPIQDGEFFFGHFTGKAGRTLELDQSFEPGKLMIELIVWDSRKQLFNFYELIGEQNGSTWFYRGDSQDILNDNQLLYRTSLPKFGNQLRCSACHASGGPIMKEMAAPHNDWWTQKRPLVFGNAAFSNDVKIWLDQVQDASSFSRSVQKGIRKLYQSPNYQTILSSSSLQEQLRPLFCDTEINLVSSKTTAEENAQTFEISSHVFLNPYFGSAKISVSKQAYQALMKKYGLQFPENHLQDSDHVWLSPVKAQSDLFAIQILIQKGVITEEFAYDVMAVDVQTNLLSQARCELLKLIPNSPTRNWLASFTTSLKNSQTPAASVLLRNLTDPQMNKASYVLQAQKYLKALQSSPLQEAQFVKLLQDRVAVRNAAISKNPRGQILEPGFRVIFPEPQR